MPCGTRFRTSRLVVQGSAFWQLACLCRRQHGRPARRRGTDARARARQSASAISPRSLHCDCQIGLQNPFMAGQWRRR